MCGIIGVVKFGSTPQACDEQQLSDSLWKGLSLLAHRGPDSYGTSVVSREAGLLVALGHRRLAIIDPTPAGSQPMTDCESGNAIVFNGEIYNYRELAREIVAMGFQLKSKSDTEVVLLGYRAFGPSIFRKIKGMFAIAIWDRGKRLLLIARDQVGVKPLYLCESHGQVWFSSEVRALIAVQGAPRLDRSALGGYLRYGSVQEPTTLVEGIRSLAPGTLLAIASDGARVESRFWSPLEALTSCGRHGYSLEERMTVLQQVIESQLVADVTVGVFLSSGIDSAAVAALAAENHRIRTFCVGFEDDPRDERSDAAKIARRIGSLHTDVTIGFAEASIAVEGCLSAMDQPSVDGLNTYVVSEAVRKVGVKVALSGLGGDELFGGYGMFAKPRKLVLWGQLARLGPEVLSRNGAGLLSMLVGFYKAEAITLRDIVATGGPHTYFSSRVLFDNESARSLTAGNADVESVRSIWREREAKLLADTQHLDDFTKISVLEMSTYMLSTLLRDADQMSMAHSLELRVPLVDPRLIEAFLPLSSREKCAGGLEKAILRRAIDNHVSPRFEFARKRGFNLPIDTWMRRGFVQAAEESLLQNRSGLWDRSAMELLLRDLRSGRTNWARIWALFALERWLVKHRVQV